MKSHRYARKLLQICYLLTVDDSFAHQNFTQQKQDKTYLMRLYSVVEDTICSDVTGDDKEAALRRNITSVKT